MAGKSIGLTKSGKTIYAHQAFHKHFDDWTSEDHVDAAEAHRDAATEARYGANVAHTVAYDRAKYTPPVSSWSGHNSSADEHVSRAKALDRTVAALGLGRKTPARLDAEIAASLAKRKRR
jgi:hypothetical protein